jgi:hypothetical protein
VHVLFESPNHTHHDEHADTIETFFEVLLQVGL